MRLACVVAMTLIHRATFAAPSATEPDTLDVPAPESSAPEPASLLPAVPSFELPPPAADYFEPSYLLLRGRKHFDTDVTVRGYIIWIYDCVLANQALDETRVATQKRIDADPTLCERPKFYIASTRDTPLVYGLWVVDVPRPTDKREKPAFKVGDYVAISGRFAARSPNGEAHSDGLLVYREMKRVKPTTRPLATNTAASAPTVVLPAPVKPPPPMRKVVDPKVINISFVSLERGNELGRNQRYADAVEAYRRAIASWDGNHLAWYGLGNAHWRQRNDKLALDAFKRAASLRPDAAMYQLWAGIAAYDAAITATREAEAIKVGVKPNAVTLDYSLVPVDEARAFLQQALALDAGLWRAHWTLGRIARNANLDRAAAEHYTMAARTGIDRPAPYLALVELYRAWGYTKQAIAVGELGAKRLSASEWTTADVLYSLAAAHHARKSYARAVSALTRAYEINPDHHAALLYRGQAFLRLGKRKQARRDVEAFMAAAATGSNPPSHFVRAQAIQVLRDVGALK